MSLLTENYNDVLNNRQNFVNPPVGSQPRPEPTETPLTGADEPTLMGERLYLPVPFRESDLYIFDLLRHLRRLGRLPKHIHLVPAPPRNQPSPSSSCRHTVSRGVEPPRSSALLNAKTCNWCTRFGQRLTGRNDPDNYGILQPDSMFGLEPLMHVCCLAQWALQRFTAMEVCYLVIPGIPHPSTRGWKKSL